MQAHPLSVSEVIGGQKQYVIPVFQRTYEWEKERCATLWRDLSALVEESDQELTHFIGPMVVISQAFPHDVPKHLVIDGQQRLMTLTVLLAAIRDRAKDLKYQSIASAVDSNTLFFLNTKGDKVPKLIPRIRDRDALSSILGLQALEPDPNLRITQAYQFFYSELEQATPIQRSLFDSTAPPREFLDVLYKAVIQRLKIVIISLDSSDDPSSIYESLNFKHETLKDEALIRNYVFMKLPTLEEQEEFSSAYWNAFEEIFNYVEDPGQPLTDFYYRYLISKKGYLSRKRLYASFTKYVDEYLQKNNLKQLASELTRFAKYFVAIDQGCDDDELEAAFARFRQLETYTATPLLLSLYDRYATINPETNISKETFLQMLRVIESFVLRRLILRERTRGYGLDFALAVEQSGTINELRIYFAGRGWPKNEEIRKALEDFEFYKRASKQCSLVLTEIERSFGHKEKVNLTDIGLQIEHVMPQNLTRNWREMLGEKAEEEHERLLHTLGNLTLTGYNRELGDKPFEEKKVEFRESKISLNDYFEKCDKWTEGEILRRTNALCDRFMDLWDRPENIKRNRTTNGRS